MKLTGIIYESVVDMYEIAKLSQDEFINRLQKMYKDDNVKLPNGKVVPRYDFSKTKYIKANMPVEFYCNKTDSKGKPHGKQIVSQATAMLSPGRGCKECGKEKSISTHLHNQDKFIQKAEEKWGKGRWNYSNLNYQGSEQPVDIICPKHGPFTIERAQWFISKNNPMYCKDCISDLRKERGEKRRLTQKEYIKKCQEIHTNEDGTPIYTYEKLLDGTTPYTGGLNDILVTCPKHGPFPIRAQEHLYSGNGCPTCKESKGEKSVRKYLYEKNFKNTSEMKFDGCFSFGKVTKRCFKLPFDFYLPELKIAIEIDGRQHFYPIYGEENLKKTIFNDKLRNKFVESSKDIKKLIRIDYDRGNTDKLISELDRLLKDNSSNKIVLSSNYPKLGWNK